MPRGSPSSPRGLCWEDVVVARGRRCRGQVVKEELAEDQAEEEDVAGEEEPPPLSNLGIYVGCEEAAKDAKGWGLQRATGGKGRVVEGHFTGNFFNF